MEILQSPMSLMALVVAVVGIAVFGLAPWLPSAFPAWSTRMVGMFCLLTSLAPIYAVSESWPITSGIAAIGLLAISIIHIAQTRSARPHTAAAAETAPSTETADASQ